LTSKTIHALQEVASFDTELQGVIEVLQSAQAQMQDAAHSLGSYLGRTEVEPERLRMLDERLSSWMSLARRYRRQASELPALLAQWKDELQTLDAATDVQALERALAEAEGAFKREAALVSAARKKAAPKLSQAVTLAMQQLGMSGGRFEVQLLPQDGPQSWGLESAEFLVAGHEGSTPRLMAKVASGGELSRIALAIAVTTAVTPSQLPRTSGSSADSAKASADAHSDASAGTLIFDEIDAGVGGAVADTVGRLMKQLGRDRQVLAVTHLPQVAACADQHFVVSKAAHGGQTRSEVQSVQGETRVAEIARMLGGERLSSTSLAHAQEMLLVASSKAEPTATPPSANPLKTPRGARS
jgi:DNA repair protein RecN (Recombination protein N)